jgi:hypothetical protein
VFVHDGIATIMNAVARLISVTRMPMCMYRVTAAEARIKADSHLAQIPANH